MDALGALLEGEEGGHCWGQGGGGEGGSAAARLVGVLGVVVMAVAQGFALGVAHLNYPSLLRISVVRLARARATGLMDACSRAPLGGIGGSSDERSGGVWRLGNMQKS